MQRKNIILISLILAILIIFCYIFHYYSGNFARKKIAKLTDNWIDAVVKEQSPEKIAKLFCKNAELVGTVSQIIRRNEDIKLYFDYFAKLPNISVLEKEYNIMKIDPNTYMNTAYILWNWDGLEKPIMARMTFIFEIGWNSCLIYLHSSALPDLNENLYKISGKK